MKQAGQIIIVMGVSGSGKSTIAEHIAARLDADFLDADTLHPAHNIAKMSRGEALNDTDRAPWLEAVRDATAQRAKAHTINVTACSALKARYRNTLREAGNVAFVYLDGSKELIAGRMQERTGHFMPDSLLDSQFAALEHPGKEPGVYSVSIEPGPELIAENAVKALAPFLRSTNTDGFQH